MFTCTATTVSLSINMDQDYFHLSTDRTETVANPCNELPYFISNDMFFSTHLLSFDHCRKFRRMSLVYLIWLRLVPKFGLGAAVTLEFDAFI